MVSTETSPAPTESAWNDDLLRNPHAVADKRTRVQRMFAAIAPSYDLNNRLHSLWMDQYWRRKAVKLAELKPDDRVVDVACGTGDLALRFEHHRELDPGTEARARRVEQDPFDFLVGDRDRNRQGRALFAVERDGDIGGEKRRPVAAERRQVQRKNRPDVARQDAQGNEQGGQ